MIEREIVHPPFILLFFPFFFFFSSRRRHTRWPRDWSSDVCSSDLYFFLFVCFSGSSSSPIRNHFPNHLYVVSELITVQGVFSDTPICWWNKFLRSHRSEERRVGKECRSHCVRDYGG